MFIPPLNSGIFPITLVYSDISDIFRAAVWRYSWTRILQTYSRI